MKKKRKKKRERERGGGGGGGVCAAYLEGESRGEEQLHERLKQKLVDT